MKNNQRILAMTQIAVMTAVIAVLSQLAVPMPSAVPLTLQTFGIALCAYLGGMRKGVPAAVVYLALGGVGMPVFSHFRGGIGMLFDLTGGFLWGFLPLAILCAVGMRMSRKPLAVLMGMLGLLLCHLCGVLQYTAAAGTGVWESFLLVSVPYLLKDGISVGAAYFAALTVQKALNSAGMRNI